MKRHKSAALAWCSVGLGFATLSGCVVAPTPAAGGTDSGASDAAGADSGGERSDGGVPDARVFDATPADDGPMVADAALADAALPPGGGCAALCEARQRDLGPEGGCGLESFRTPGISYDCTQTCERARAWQPALAAAAITCVAREYLCFESLETCAIRLSEADTSVAVTVQIQMFEGGDGTLLGLSGAFFAPLTARSDAEGLASFVLQAPLQSLQSFALLLWIDDGDGRCDLRADRFGQAWLPSLEQIGGEAEAHPLASGEMALYLTENRAQWVDDAPRRLPEACAGFPQ